MEKLKFTTELTEAQEKHGHKCPECGGELYEIRPDTELLLFCRECDVSIDSDGGIIK